MTCNTGKEWPNTHVHTYTDTHTKNNPKNTHKKESRGGKKERKEIVGAMCVFNVSTPKRFQRRSKLEKGMRDWILSLPSFLSESDRDSGMCDCFSLKSIMQTLDLI